MSSQLFYVKIFNRKIHDMETSLKKRNSGSWNFLHFKIIDHFSSQYWFTCALYCISIAKFRYPVVKKTTHIFDFSISEGYKRCSLERFHCSIVFRNACNNWKRTRDISLIFRNLCWRLQFLRISWSFSLTYGRSFD